MKTGALWLKLSLACFSRGLLFLAFLLPFVSNSVFAETVCSYNADSLVGACANWMSQTPRSNILWMENVFSAGSVTTAVCHGVQFDENWSQSVDRDISVSCNSSCTAGSGQTVNPVTGECVCPDGKTLNAGVCSDVGQLDDCSTSLWGDLSGDSSDGSCDCPSDKDFWNGQCKTKCLAGESRNMTTGECESVCTAPEVWNIDSCSCPDGKTLFVDMDSQRFCVDPNAGGTGTGGTGTGGTGTGGTGTGGTGTGGTGTGDTGTGGTGTGGTGTGGTGTGDTGTGDTGTGGTGTGGTGTGGTGTGGTGTGGTGTGDTGTGGTGTGGTGTGGTGTGDTGTGDTGTGGTGTGDTGTGDTGTGGSGTGGTGNGDNSDVSSKLADIAAGLGVANGHLNNLDTKIPSSFAGSLTSGAGSFPHDDDSAKITDLKNSITGQVSLIKQGFSASFAPPTLSGVGHLPCYRAIPLFAGQTFDLCFSDYEEKLSLIPVFITGLAYLLAAFIIIGGYRND